MTAILTPALALRHLRQLSTDVRGAVVLDGEGAPLAGDAALAGPAAALAALLPAGACELLARVGDGAAARGSAIAARPPAGTAPTLVLAVGPLAPLELLLGDVATAVGALAGDAAEGLAPAPLPPAPLLLRRPGDAAHAVEERESAVRAAISAATALLDAAAAARAAAAR